MSTTRAKSAAHSEAADTKLSAGNGAPRQDKASHPIALPEGLAADVSLRLEDFLLDVADTLNSTLEMDKLLGRVAELVRQIIDYEIFAILLLNERTQDLRI